MEAALWRVLVRAVPGPAGLALWIFATVTAPLLFFEAGHRWEEDQTVSAAVWWTVPVAALLGATTAAKWRRHDAAGRTLRSCGSAVGVATLISAVFSVASIAVYRWVIPLSGTAAWRHVLLGGLGAAVCGAVAGYLAVPSRLRTGRPAGRRGYVVGGILVALGALFAQTTVQLGAEDSTVGEPVTSPSFGWVGSYPTSRSPAGLLTLPAAGRYAIFSVGPGPLRPDCHVIDGDVNLGSVEAVTIPPSDYGGDAASYAWVASFDAPRPGTFSLSCDTADADESYTVQSVPEIRGAVASMIHWPLAAIWALGAVPGLLMIAATARRRSKRHTAPGFARGDTAG